MHMRSCTFWLLFAVLMHSAFTGLMARPVLAQDASVAVDPDHAAKRTKGLELFKSKVRGTLKQHCVSCHGENSTEGKLDLATQAGMLTNCHQPRSRRFWNGLIWVLPTLNRWFLKK